MKQLAALSIPVFVLAIGVGGFLNVRGIYEPHWLLPIVNTAFLFVPGILVAAVSLRGYFASGSVPLLLFGSAAMVFGTGSLIGGVLIGSLDRTDPGVVLHNTAAALGGLLNAGSGFLISGKRTSLPRASRRTVMLLLYASLGVVLLGLTLASLRGLTPTFVLPQGGFSPVRNTTLAIAVGCFTGSAFLFAMRYRERRSDFLYWGALALSLLSLGLCALFLQPAVGSLIGWCARSAQYLGSLYFLAAVGYALREAQHRQIPVAQAVADLFLEAEENLRLIVEMAGDAVVAFDQDDRVLLWNAAAVRTFGRQPGEVLGERLGPLAGLEAPLAAWQATVATQADPTASVHLGSAMQVEARRKDGSCFPAECSISARQSGPGWVGTLLLRDISDRKRTEREVASLAKFPAENPLPVLRLAADGTLLHANAAGLPLYTTARVWTERRPPVPWRDLAGEVLSAGAAREIEVVSGDCVFLVFLVPIRDEGYVNLYGRDITEQKRAEDAIRRLNDDLEEQIRRRTVELEVANRELEAFSYSVSHDLRAPLRAIDGFSRILGEEYAKVLDAEGRRLLGVILGNVSRMGALIDDLMALSRVGQTAFRRERVEMTALAQEAFQEVAGAETERDHLDFRLAPLTTATGDPALLRQVWVNLLGNAVKFSAPKALRRIEVGERMAAGRPVYFVKDNGVGFDMRYAHKLFGVFQRLHTADEFPGTGVGLALVQRIVRRHGGDIWAEATVGAGATFSFTLSKEEAIA